MAPVAIPIPPQKGPGALGPWGAQGPYGGAGQPLSAVYAGTLRDPNGDLLRILGMKVVSLTGLLMEINRELLISLKLRRVCHISFSIAAAFDRR